MKKKNNFWKNFFIILLVIYTALYMSKSLGYYEFLGQRQNYLNEKEIASFEADVKKGKQVNIKDYRKEEKITYKNTFSNIGFTLSKQVGLFFTDGIQNTFSFFGKFLTN